MIRTLLLSAALASLGGCGFQPLYAGSSFNGTSDNSIRVEEIEGRSGYLLRQNLVRELAIGLPGYDQQAVLTVQLDESLSRAALLPDGAVSRSFIIAKGTYFLESDAGVLEGDAEVQVPYAATNSPYADVAAQIQSSKSAMNELARQIVNELRLQVQADS